MQTHLQFRLQSGGRRRTMPSEPMQAEPISPNILQVVGLPWHPPPSANKATITEDPPKYLGVQRADEQKDPTFWL